LSTTPGPTRLAQGSTTTPLWEAGLLPHPHSQPLFLVLPFFTESWAPCLTLFSKAGSVFHPNPTVSVRLQFTVYVFQFCSGGAGSICPGAALDCAPRGWVGEPCVARVGTYWVCRFMQVALKLVSREKWCSTFLKADTYWDWVQCSRV
jgi:hypothetical protein